VILQVRAADTAASTGRRVHIIIDRMRANPFACGGTRVACNSFLVAFAKGLLRKTSISSVGM